MLSSHYLPRVVDAELADRLARIGAVLIEGAKGCGKTETASQHSASMVRLDIDETARATAEVAPANVLDGAAPRLIDEWQLVPRLWNEVRRAVDARRAPGQFILTGSATPADDATRHTGAGRVSRLRMRTLSLWESNLSAGAVRLSTLMSGDTAVSGTTDMTLDDLIEETCHGGWPVDRNKSWRLAQANVADYCAEIANTDIRTADGTRRDSARVRLLMQSLARHTATAARQSTLASDAARPALAEDTVSSYLGALERLMVVEPLTSWSPVLRSRARIRVSAKHHFVDPSMTATLLNARPDELRRDLKTYGFLFESLALRDLRVYAQSLGASVHHYLDSTGLEVDAIVDGGFGRWGAIEVKLGGAAEVLDRAASRLRAFAAKVDQQSTGEPRFLAIVTATGYAHTRRDGVAVIPLAALRP
ncbi:MAG: DUF4143 domain-containing protein [Actinomycetia bacterium]|nr:DUF4143 domain-containing protein [Actinomycetes bacterium]